MTFVRYLLSFILFADDTNLFASHKSLIKLFNEDAIADTLWQCVLYDRFSPTVVSWTSPDDIHDCTTTPSDSWDGARLSSLSVCACRPIHEDSDRTPHRNYHSCQSASWWCLMTEGYAGKHHSPASSSCV